MPTDDLLHLIKDSFDNDTRIVTASPALADDVRKTLRTRRRTGVLLASAAVAATALAVTVASGHGHDSLPTVAEHGNTSSTVHPPHHVGLKDVRYASFTFKVPAQATVSKSCLPKSAEYLGPNQRVGEQFMLVDRPHRSPCVGATIWFTKRPATTTDKVVDPGERTVYLTASDPGTRSGYVALTKTQSANAAAAVDGAPGTYYEVFTLPSDTSRSVLVAGLRQSRAAG
jgi:hypothetical protein